MWGVEGDGMSYYFVFYVNKSGICVGLTRCVVLMIGVGYF